ncbi:pentatricopeptide repeat-containing protein-like [Dorcoceras hygrometricum]|uniref:Pentatricopeptide repeat-containing protein-like n=1 Tax=Dorcoceras hygrometricum TaxID=472368 RepID=A0A2Z6ZTP5_9LAMI|nr:pentatricopeptide repeat-containing protein-like [Dorcoceras hygrometricum]
MLLSRSADIVLSLQRVFAKKCKRQRFDKLERRRGVHCFVSADEDFSRLFVEVVQQLLSLFVEECDTTAFCLIQQKRSFDISADSYSDFISADALLVVASRCFTKIAKRCRLNKLTRHRFIAKEISRWKNAYAFQQMNSSKWFSRRF